MVWLTCPRTSVVHPFPLLVFLRVRHCETSEGIFLPLFVLCANVARRGIIRNDGEVSGTVQSFAERGATCMSYGGILIEYNWTRHDLRNLFNVVLYRPIRGFVLYRPIRAPGADAKYLNRAISGE